MPKIHLLDRQVAELIAAGEVVERPSSVIKELVENAIDAGATSVVVEIRNGGVTFMRVTDNGCGIAHEDVPTAFLRHATSKIQNPQDLDAIFTLGFRGEALASISAVSKLEMMTRPGEEELGTRYITQGADGYELEEVGCPVGTTIIIRDLFYNVPARMKFLKKDITEGNAVAGIMDKIALSHPEISIRLIRDGKENMHTPGDGKLLSAIYAVFGREFSSSLLPVDYTQNHVKVWGYISAPKGARANRSMQNFFINGRYIKSRTAGVALDEAFKGSIMVGKFAACVLNIEISHETVDVNVHPAKLEVRFADERPIFDAVYHGVKTALQRGDTPKEMILKKPPSAEIVDQGEVTPKEAAAPQKLENEMPLQTSIAAEPAGSVVLRDIEPAGFQTNWFQHSRTKIGSFLDIEVTPEEDEEKEAEAVFIRSDAHTPVGSNTTQGVEPPKEVTLMPEIGIKFIGEAFGTYIILQYGEDSLMLIDKHAAHERLIYEQLKQTKKGGEAQVLLEPVTVTLEKNEYSAVLSNLSILAEAGFDVEDFGPGLILVRTTPLFLDQTDTAASIMEIAGYLSDNKTEVTTEHLDWLYHNIACRAAIKGGDRSGREELIELARRLEENPEIRYCPHGRPISILLKRQELEKQFGRIV